MGLAYNIAIIVLLILVLVCIIAVLVHIMMNNVVPLNKEDKEKNIISKKGEGK